MGRSVAEGELYIIYYLCMAGAKAAREVGSLPEWPGRRAEKEKNI
jgi:hypothetical protein